MANKIIIPNADFSVNAIRQEQPVTPVEYTLHQGYASANGTTKVAVNNNLATRVRTDELYGKYHIKLKNGYLIRALLYYDSSIDYTTAGDKTTTGVVTAVASTDNLSEYTLNVAKYSCITFCRADATQNISPTEDIIEEIYYVE